MKRPLVTLLLATMILAACTPPPVARVPVADSSQPPVNVLFVTQGQVCLQREGWPGFRPTSFGTELRERDLLQVDTGGQATVLCSGLTAWPVPAGVASGALNGCAPGPKPALIRDGHRVPQPKAPFDPLIPYVISPRVTELKADRPILRWKTVDGVKSYTVVIWRTDPDASKTVEHWRATTTTSELPYPTDAPALSASATYSVQVVADNGRRSDEEKAQEISFKLLAPGKRGDVEGYDKTLRDLNLPSDAEAYARVLLYAGHGLRAEALDILAGLAARGSREPAVYRTLGDLYRSLGVAWQAREPYELAARLAADVDDREGQAAALAGLGEVYISLGYRDQAHDNWRQAARLYRDVGEQAGAARMEKRIGDTE